MSQERIQVLAWFRNKDVIQKIGLGVFLALIIFLSLFPVGTESVHFNVKLSDSTSKMSETFGYSDAGSYLKAALELSSLNQLTSNQHWVINLWPPGMLLLDAFLVRVFNDGFGIALAMLTSIVWFCLLYAFSLKVRQKFGFLVALLSTSLLAISPALQSWVIGSGIYYAEGFSIAALIAGLIFLLKSSVEFDIPIRIAYGVTSGCLFAIAAYFRTTFFTIQFGLLSSIVLAMMILLYLGFTSQNRLKIPKIFDGVVSLLSAWVAMVSLMEPWLQYKQSLYGSRGWSATGDGFFRGVFVERESQPSFLSGVGWGCEINPEFCQVVQEYQMNSGQPYPFDELRSQVFLTALANPIDYLGDRLHFILLNWNSSPIVLSFISMIAFLGMIGFLLWRAVKLNIVFFAIFTILGLVFAPALIGHIEPRYFYPLQLSVILLPWLITSNSNRTQSEDRQHYLPKNSGIFKGNTT